MFFVVVVNWKSKMIAIVGHSFNIGLTILEQIKCSYLCTDIADLKKYSPLKPLGEMNRHLVGSIYGRSSVKIAHFVLIR